MTKVFYTSTFRRFLLRRDLFRRIAGRLRLYQRIITKEPVEDIQQLLKGETVAVIVDAGANIGFMTNEFRRRFPNATVHAFEPNPEVYQVLRDAHASDERVIANHGAIGARQGTMTFHVNSNTGTSSFLEPTSYHRSHMARREVRTLDVTVFALGQYLQERKIDHVDILKLDIEGYEVEAMRGCESFLRDGKIDVVMTEVNIVRSYEGQPLLHEVTRFMEGYDYSLYNLYGFTALETEIGQGIVGDAVFLSSPLRKRLEARFGKQACGW